jgi:hypothetical protein
MGLASRGLAPTEGRWVGQQMVGEVARSLSLFGGASSEVRRCGCSVVSRCMRLSEQKSIFSPPLNIPQRRPRIVALCRQPSRSAGGEGPWRRIVVR